MSKRVYISLAEAAETSRQHAKDVQPPILTKAQNVYPSTADRMLTLRPDLAPASAQHIYTLGSNSESCGVFRHPIGMNAEVRDAESRPLHVEQFGRFVIINAPNLNGVAHGPYITAPLEVTGDEDWQTGSIQMFVNFTNSDVADKPVGRVMSVLYDSGSNKYLIGLAPPPDARYGRWSGSSYENPTHGGFQGFGFGATNNAGRAVIGPQLRYTTNYIDFYPATVGSSYWYDVCWADALSRFIAVGPSTAATSPTGEVFEITPINSYEAFLAVRFSERINKVIAVGDGGAIATSSDGVNWDVSSVGESAILWGIAEDPATCVVVTSGSGIFRSTDGITWAKVDSRTARNIVWTGSEFIAVIEDKLSTSEDGEVWSTPVTLPHGRMVLGLWYANGRIFCAAAEWAYLVSSLYSGTSIANLSLVWPQYWYSGPGGVLNHVRVENTIIAFGSNGWIRTLDLETKAETIRKSGVPFSLFAGAVRGSEVILCGDGGTIISSSDSGATWTARDSGTTALLRDIWWANDGSGPYGRIIAVGQEPAVVLYSTDGGLTWSPAAGIPSTSTPKRVAWARGKWAVLVDSTIYQSSDGINFSYAAGIQHANLLTAVSSGFVLCSSYGIWFSPSPDGPWTFAPESNSLPSFVGLETDGEYAYVLSASHIRIISRCHPGKKSVERFISFESIQDQIFGERFVVYNDVVFIKGYKTGRSMIWMRRNIGNASHAPARLLHDKYKSAAFASVDGQVLLLNVTEDGTKYSRRVRWSAPGTYDKFDPDDMEFPGAGFDDYIGLGEFIDARTLGHNVIAWETNAVSVFSQTGFLEAPWEYRRLAEGIQLASNPCVVNDAIYFLSKDGLLYVANSVSVKPANLPFDLTKFADFANFERAWLAYEPRMNALCVYAPSADATMYVISLASGLVSHWKLPLLNEGDGAFIYPTGVCSLPAGVADSTLFLVYAGRRLAQFTFESGATGIDVVREAAEGESGPLERLWHAEIELGELPLGGESTNVRILQVEPRVYHDEGDPPALLAWIREGTETEWIAFGDRNGTAVGNGDEVTGVGTLWSNKVANGDDSTTIFTVPYWAGLSRLYRDSVPLISGSDYSPVDEGNGLVFTKTVELSAPLPTSSTLFSYWENEPRVTVRVGDYFSDPNGNYYRITSVRDFRTCEIERDAGVDAELRHHYAAQPTNKEDDVGVVCHGVFASPQVRIVVIPRGANVVKLIGMAVQFVIAGARSG